MRRLTPYLLLVPGGAWLVVFFAIPMGFMLTQSLSQGTADTGFQLTWNFGIYPEVIGEFWDLFVRSAFFALATTVLTILIGYPTAYTIAFHGGRLKNALLLIVVMPFFVSFVIRTLNWRMILSDNGLVFGTLKDMGILDPAFHFLATPASVIFGLTYNFLPFMILPLYVAIEKIDRRLIEAATDLFASRRQAFWRVTFPLSLPGVIGASVLIFVPTTGDYVTPQLVGGPTGQMIAYSIQVLFLKINDWPLGAALAMSAMAAVGILVVLFVTAMQLAVRQIR